MQASGFLGGGGNVFKIFLKHKSLSYMEEESYLSYG